VTADIKNQQPAPNKEEPTTTTNSNHKQQQYQLTAITPEYILEKFLLELITDN
jgi:hypothetical protein